MRSSKAASTGGVYPRAHLSISVPSNELHTLRSRIYTLANMLACSGLFCPFCRRLLSITPVLHRLKRLDYSFMLISHFSWGMTNDARNAHTHNNARGQYARSSHNSDGHVMWQSRVENEHYSVSMKIAFSTSINALGHCMRSPRLLAPLRMCAESYGPCNTAHFGIAAYCNYCRISKYQDK